MAEHVIQIDKIENIMELLGSYDENIKLLEKQYGVSIVYRGSEIMVRGDEAAVSLASRAIGGLVALLKKGEALTDQNVRYVISLVGENNEDKLASIADDCVCITVKGKPIKPKTLGQQKYIDAIRKNSITLGVGPAGTGKTYLAVALAVAAFRKGDCSRIILTRPAVEAGEKLGFLPGDLQQKIDPYLRPLYDALYDVLGRDAALKLKEKEVIEVVPLAYMRGTTLDNSFIILDEAQNTTREQMKMFLTRMGFGSKVVVTGDVTQIDLPRGKKSGLVEALRVLKNVRDIDVCYLKDTDVVRHELVRKIINAYEQYYKKYPEEMQE